MSCKAFRLLKRLDCAEIKLGSTARFAPVACRQESSGWG
jgi:hypothetical protein